MSQNTLPILDALRLQDVLDIAIVAVMISVLLIWFKDRASRFVFIGVSVVGVIFLVARFFQFYLTTIALQGFFAILLFILVVIFQEDLRRFFERLAIFSHLGKDALAQDASYDAQIEMIVETAMNLAKNRIGALIVIKGAIPWTGTSMPGRFLMACRVRRFWRASLTLIRPAMTVPC
jgi:DNA integrity scanning protein DisA with diadenylate cyclase activity